MNGHLPVQASNRHQITYLADQRHPSGRLRAALVRLSDVKPIRSRMPELTTRSGGELIIHQPSGPDLSSGFR